MKPCLVKLALFSTGTLMAPQALAQPAPAPAPKAVNAAAASLKASSSGAAAVTITAAGSVIVLADGIVANAVLAQIQPPAPGFVYER